MARAISVSLDDEALKALHRLEATGLGRSEAVRMALLSAAARLANGDTLRSEVRALENDADDRREMLDVAELMRALRGATTRSGPGTATRWRTG